LPDDPPMEIKLSTADLWKYLDFQNYKKGPNYPFYIDALMFMGLILDHYTQRRKPIFYITGNHEGYEVPYGISPRIINTNVYVFRANPGIPSDQNLTFYEAALLFGKKFSYLGRVANFKKENLAWAYQWITPWKDCLVNSGKNQNLLLLGWDDDENYLWSAISGGGSLPRAGSAYTDNQLSLLQQMTSQEDKFNVVASHFTYANFDNEIPLQKQDQNRSGGMFSLKKTDTGSFEENRKAVYSQLSGGKIKLTVSGHSHRGGAYTCFGDGQVDGLRLEGPGSGQGVNLSDSGRALKSFDPQTQFDGRVACLVSGSGGLYSYQNLNDSELAKYSDIDKPQGMLVKCDDLGNIYNVQYVQDEKSKKPRLAVRCDYLWYEDHIKMFNKRSDDKEGDLASEKGDKPGEKYNIYINPKWLKFLNGSSSQHELDLPFEYFTLHPINLVTYRYLGKYPIRFEITGKSQPPRGHPSNVPIYGLSLGPHDVRTLLNDMFTLGNCNHMLSVLFFLSVHFNQAHPIGKHYDLESPWCYPVSINSDFTEIKRKFGLDGELPRYGILNKLPEYKFKEDD
jgi:hypothetical protein